jgi:hypothetical protein
LKKSSERLRRNIATYKGRIPRKRKKLYTAQELNYWRQGEKLRVGVLKLTQAILKAEQAMRGFSEAVRAGRTRYELRDHTPVTYITQAPLERAA